VTGYLDIGGAAQFLDVSVRTIRRRLPSIPHYRTDFGLRFSQEDLAEYMAQFLREPKVPARIDLDRILGRGGHPDDPDDLTLCVRLSRDRAGEGGPSPRAQQITDALDEYHQLSKDPPSRAVN
jgi:hypothetical protein